MMWIKIGIVLGVWSSCFAGGLPEDKFMPPSSIPSDISRESYTPVEPTEDVLKDQYFSRPPDWIYQASEWVLNLYILKKEYSGQIRSHGVLICEGDEIKGYPGETRALPIGTVTYVGRKKSNGTGVMDSGWQMKDPLVKPIVNGPDQGEPMGQ